jgi:hypothetical protein
MVCVFKTKDGLIKMYYLKIRSTKQTVVFLAVTRAETCDVKPKYVFIENVSGSKDRVERTKSMGKCFINWKTFI